MGFLKKKPKNIINFLFLYEIYLYLCAMSNQVAESCKKGGTKLWLHVID